MNDTADTYLARLLEQPLNDLALDARGRGDRLIGYTCSYVPEPLIGVPGLVPVRTRAPGVSGTPLADTYLSSVLCSYTRSILEFAMDGHYNDLDGWVFASSCDHLRRLYDNLAYLENPLSNYIIDLPHKITGPAADWFHRELKTLADALAADFGVDTGPAALKASIDELNEFNALLRGIGELRKEDNPPVTGRDFHQIIAACAASPKKALKETIAGLLREMKGGEGAGEWRARLMLVGSQLDDPAYIGVIESVGGLVVADRCCLGSIPGLDPIECGPDPLRSLADHYLAKTSCPRMMEEFGGRVAEIIGIAREYRADGIIIETMKFCDCWGVDSGLLATALRDAGIPALRVEREYSMSGEGQLRTRVQAFIESMGK